MNSKYDTLGEMSLSSVTWSSVALVTLNANRNMMQIAILKKSFRFQFSGEMVEKMFSEVEIKIL